MGYGGRIAFRVARGRVTVHALPPEQHGEEAADPALAPFLALLEADLPGRAPALPKRLTGRLETLAAEVGEVNPEAPIEGEASL